jgi:hypothetical protein
MLLPLLHLPDSFFHVHGRLLGRHELRHGPSVPGYQESFTTAYPVEQLREMCFGIVNTDGGHSDNLRSDQIV